MEKMSKIEDWNLNDTNNILNDSQYCLDIDYTNPEVVSELIKAVRYSVEEVLDIFDEKWNRIWIALREDAHREWLLHQVSHVRLYTSDGYIILQKRPQWDWKSRQPWKLDAPVSWHIRSWEDELIWTVRETKEESDLTFSEEDLKAWFIGIFRYESHWTKNWEIWNNLEDVHIFILKYDWPLEDLKIDPSETEKFIAMPLDDFEKELKEDEEKEIKCKKYAFRWNFDKVRFVVIKAIRNKLAT